MKKVPSVIRANEEAHKEILDEMMKAYKKMLDAMNEREKDMKDPDLAFNVGYRVGVFQGIGETVVDEIDPDKKKAEKEAIKTENVTPAKTYIDANVKGTIMNSEFMDDKFKTDCKDKK